MSEVGIGPLMARQGDRVRAVLNLLLESPYFYKSDDENAFHFLRRHRSEFTRFFTDHFGWSLIMDGKCARVYKDRWYNREITESNRDFFNFSRRDECIGFMILLEFFEHQLEDNGMTVEDRDNLRFRFGDLLEFATRRFREVFPGEVKYEAEFVRAKVLRQILPVLERYRFLSRIPPPADESVSEEHTLFEALPALYHYNSAHLGRNLESIRATAPGENQGTEDAEA
jgi:hypothetical protein